MSSPTTNAFSLYETSSLPNCDTAYHGAYINASIYVVGMKTDRERIFKRAEVTEAVSYAKTSKLMIAHLPAKQFCHDAMVQFLGA